MLTRKCAVCGKEIQLTLPYSKQYIYYATKKRWYHLDCFITVTTPRTHTGDWIVKTSDFVRSEVSKDNICQLFYNHYNISCIPSRLFKKLSQIYDGTYKGLAQPIPPHELFDILERKMEYLDKNAIKKNLSGVSRINYDLAVAIGSYKSYKEWQSSLKAEQEQTKQEAEERQGYHYKLRGYIPPSEPETDNMFISLYDDETA